MFRMLRRTFAEAASSVVKNGLMTVASITVVVFCLFIFGVFAILTINVNYLSEQIVDQCHLQAYIDSSIDDTETINNIEQNILKVSYIKNSEYISGEETFANFKKGLTPKELEAFEGIPDDIISDSFKITLTDISHADNAYLALKKIDGIEKIENPQGIFNSIDRITKFVKNISIWIVIIFALVSIFIISNTIKLTVHNRRKEINIMKYVGATDAYIRGPFVIEGMIVGIISAIIAFFATWYLYNTLEMFGLNAIDTLIRIKTFAQIMPVIIASYAIIGLGLGAIGSAVSIRKYLKV